MTDEQFAALSGQMSQIIELLIDMRRLLNEPADIEAMAEEVTRASLRRIEEHQRMMESGKVTQ